LLGLFEVKKKKAFREKGYHVENHTLKTQNKCVPVQYRILVSCRVAVNVYPRVFFFFNELLTVAMCQFTGKTTKRKGIWHGRCGFQNKTKKGTISNI
jgi:hypothetical protein